MQSSNGMIHYLCQRSIPIIFLYVYVGLQTYHQCLSKYKLLNIIWFTSVICISTDGEKLMQTNFLYCYSGPYSCFIFRKEIWITKSSWLTWMRSDSWHINKLTNLLPSFPKGMGLKFIQFYVLLFFPLIFEISYSWFIWCLLSNGMFPVR